MSAVDHADVVVIGAGTAGGTIAARLSEDEDRRVLLLEAGPDFPDEATDPPAFVTGGPGAGGTVAWAELRSGLSVAICHDRMFGAVSLHPFTPLADAVRAVAAG